MLEHPQHADAIARGADCTRCPLYGRRRGPVPSELRAGVLVQLGEAPGSHEVAEGRPFVGPSGAVADEARLMGGLTRDDSSVLNVIGCQPHASWAAEPGELAPSLEEYLERFERAVERGAEWAAGRVSPIVACRPRLDRELALVEPHARVLTAVGRAALDALSSRYGLGDLGALRKVHGAPVPVELPGGEGAWLIAAYHPAFGFREPKWLESTRQDLARAARIGRRGTVDWAEPPALIAPSLDELRTFVTDAIRAGAELTHDLETDSPEWHSAVILCDGVGALVDGVERVLVVPFRHVDGTPLPEEYTREARALLRYATDRLPVAGQNVSAFDWPIMVREGLASDLSRVLTDTAILHHCTREQDMPHALDWIARRHFEAPLWKSRSDVARYVEGQDVAERDQRLWARCARDVLVTHRLLAPLRAAVERDGGEAQYATDAERSVFARERGELGLVIDEARRGELSALLGQECTRLLAAWHEAVGHEVNPRSVPQMRELLYETWGYAPVVDTEGYEFDEDDDEDDAGTGAKALLALMDAGMDPRHAHALDRCLLPYKAVDKLRSTYCDAIPTLPWYEAIDRVPARGALLERGALSRVCPTWSVYRVPTGRDACSRPPEQQRPKLGPRVSVTADVVEALVRLELLSSPTARDGSPVSTFVPNMRSIVVAPPGHLIVGADYEQAEARLYAILSGDQVILRAIAEGLDIHILNCATMRARRDSEIMDLYRQIAALPKDSPERGYWKLVAKKAGFGFIYNIHPPTLFRQMRSERVRETGERAFPGLRESDCEEWFEGWHRRHPETHQFHKACEDVYRRTGWTATPVLEQRRRWGPLETNAIPNMAIQAGISAMTNRAERLIRERIPHRGWSRYSGLFVQAHDYLGAVVPEARAEEASRIFAECMPYTYLGMLFDAIPVISHDWGKQ